MTRETREYLVPIKNVLGRAKVYRGYSWAVGATVWVVAAVADAALMHADVFALDEEAYAVSSGIRAFGYVDFADVGSDEELLTIAGRAYELDADGSGGLEGGGDVSVDLTGLTTVDEQLTALAAAINGDSSASVDAVADTSADILWVYAKTAGTAGNAITLVTALTNTTASGGTLTDGAVARSGMVIPLRHVLTAQEATEGKLRFKTTLTAVHAVIVQIDDGGVLKTPDAGVSFAAGALTITEGTAPAWTAADVLHIVVVGA